MPGLFGLNVLGQYVQDTAALLDFTRRLNPAAFLVMDSPALFTGMRDAAPNAIPVYRTYHPNDAEFHLRFAPAAWLDAFPAFGGYTACGNEPSGYGDVTALVSWYVQVMRLARQRGRRLAVCAFGVGHPDENLIKAGAFDGLIRELADGYHILLLHEYAKDSTATERPYHVGRFQYWLDRAKAISIRSPRIVLTEYGRDNVGAGTGGGVSDGWRGAGLSEDAYVAFLNGAAPLYAAANIPLCIFCYGSGAGGAWQSFNIEGAARVQSDLVTANSVYQVSVLPPVTPPPTEPVPKPPNAGAGTSAVLNAPSDGINLRDAPDTSGKRMITLMDGAPLVWYRGGSVQADGYTWYWVELATGMAGWMALLADKPEEQFVAVETPAPAHETMLSTVPYYSQITSPGAAADRNDCGETCARMLIGWCLRQANVQDFPGITIDDLTRDAGKSPNAFLNLGQLERLLQLYGYPGAKYSLGGVTLARIQQEINARRPVIALVTYKHVLPSDAFDGSHFVVIVGYSADNIIVHDPYHGGAALRIPLDQFERAQTDFGGTNPHHSGVFVQ